MLNLPNLLSAFRCVAVFVLAILIAWPEGPLLGWALVLFVLAALTDFVDGRLARAWNQVTPFGRMLDSIADKLLVGVILLMLCGEGIISGIHALAAALILFREIAISGMREHLSTKGVVVPASMLAKWKTTVQLVAIAALLAAPLTPLPAAAHTSALVLLWVATFMTVVSGAQYAWGSRGAWGEEAKGTA